MSDVVNIGTAANSGNVDPLRQAFTLVNTRFQELLGTLTGRGVWVTATVYAATPTREWVTNGGVAYVCAVNHTSGTFATDLSAGRWLAVDVTQLISDLAATSATKGAAMIGSDDGASGTLWTTVKGFITRLLGANGAAMVGNTPAGSIAATTVQAAINELATEKIAAGAVTGSGLTMSTARMLGRSTAGTGAIEELSAAQVAAFAGSVTLTGAQTVAGVKTFSDKPIFSGGPGEGNTNQSCVRVHTANGYGSSSTKIRRFTTASINQGTDITYADSATLGASFTINAGGVYGISYSDDFAGSADVVGISLNTTTPATAIQSIAAAEKLAMSTTANINYSSTTTIALYLAAGSVVCAHTSTAQAAGSTASTQFTITRLS